MMSIVKYYERSHNRCMTINRQPTLASNFTATTGYFNACTLGLPTTETVTTMQQALQDWQLGKADAHTYGLTLERVRAQYANLVGVPTSHVTVGSQASSLIGIVAESLRPGDEVLCVTGDFSSTVFPFLCQQDRGITVRSVALDDLASAITPNTTLVSFSLIQSATGTVADTDRIVAAATANNALTLCDTTQAAGTYPVDARQFDATVCHTYKWLCSPRGVAMMTTTPDLLDRLHSSQTSWYGGADVWDSCYGPGMLLAADARRLDTSPAWLSWVGAEAALNLFGTLDMNEVWRRNTALGDQLCDRLGLPRLGQAIVSWADPAGEQAHKLTASGLSVSSRAGRVRVGFHLWNDEEDIDRLCVVLGMRP